MPKTKRQILRRNLAYAHFSIERAIEHISAVEPPFREYYPNLADALAVTVVGLTEANGLLDKFVMAAWGREWLDWDSFANLPDETVKRLNARSERILKGDE